MELQLRLHRRLAVYIRLVGVLDLQRRLVRHLLELLPSRLLARCSSCVVTDGHLACPRVGPPDWARVNTRVLMLQLLLGLHACHSAR